MFEAAQLADQKMPLIYGHLSEAIESNFRKRENDIVTRTCLADAMVYPGHVFTGNPTILPFNPEGGKAAIIWAMQKYYPMSDDPNKDESAKQAACMVDYNEFRNRTGKYFGSHLATQTLTDHGPDKFWEVEYLNS